MQKRPLTVSYLFFLSAFIRRHLANCRRFCLRRFPRPHGDPGAQLGHGGEAMVWLMLLAIGWSVTGWPAKKITAALQRAVKRASK